MTVPPESIEVGKCYLAAKGQVRRVIACAYDKVVFHTGRQQALRRGWPRREIMNRETFAAHAIREVPCPPELKVPIGDNS